MTFILISILLVLVVSLGLLLILRFFIQSELESISWHKYHEAYREPYTTIPRPLPKYVEIEQEWPFAPIRKRKIDS